MNLASIWWHDCWFLMAFSSCCEPCYCACHRSYILTFLSFSMMQSVYSFVMLHSQRHTGNTSRASQRRAALLFGLQTTVWVWAPGRTNCTYLGKHLHRALQVTKPIENFGSKELPGKEARSCHGQVSKTPEAIYITFLDVFLTFSSHHELSIKTCTRSSDMIKKHLEVLNSA